MVCNPYNNRFAGAYSFGSLYKFCNPKNNSLAVPMAFSHFTCLDENIKAVAYGFGTLYNFLNAVYVLLQIIISMLRPSYILLKQY